MQFQHLRDKVQAASTESLTTIQRQLMVTQRTSTQPPTPRLPDALGSGTTTLVGVRTARSSSNRARCCGRDLSRASLAPRTSLARSRIGRRPRAAAPHRRSDGCSDPSVGSAMRTLARTRAHAGAAASARSRRCALLLQRWWWSCPWPSKLASASKSRLEEEALDQLPLASKHLSPTRELHAG